VETSGEIGGATSTSRMEMRCEGGGLMMMTMI